MESEEAERTDQCMRGPRGMGGASRRERKRGKYDYTTDGREREGEGGGGIKRMMGTMRK